ncbi:uncharacterized protein [Mytilus edulis]|uniref:uncharacterized protein n=1 Tax=Mytilus edulis TaxID=6550 RepID=UPI0039EFB617
MTRFSKYRNCLVLVIFIFLLFTMRKKMRNEEMFFMKEIEKKIKTCSETVHIFSAVAQAKLNLSLIEYVVLNVLDGSIYSNYDCCIYGENEQAVHRVNAVLKETYDHGSKYADLIARQYVCSVQQINIKMQNIQLVGKGDFCNCSHNFHPVLYAAVKENKFAICAKIAYNYLNPLYLIEWFEYQKMMTVDTVLMFIQDINQDAYAVLKYYEREGIATLIPYPSKMPGKIDRGFLIHRWHNHQSTHDEQVAVYSCKEILQGFAFVAVVDVDEFIVHDKFLGYTEILTTELLPVYPDAAGFTLNASFFITDWGVSGVEPLLTSKYIRRSSPLYHRYKNIYLPNRTTSMDTHKMWPNKGYRRIELRSHNIILYHYRKCQRSDNKTDICFRFSRNTDTKMLNIMDRLYERVIAVKRRLCISAV